MKFTRARTSLIAGSMALLMLGASKPAPAETPEKTDAPYVVLVNEDEHTVEAVFDRYPELKASWDQIARFNLLRHGQPIEVPADMLQSAGLLTKIASFYGEVEVKRSFDDRFVPVVPNLLLREGDEIRTWRGGGARILFEDGNYVLLRSQSRAKLVSLGDKSTPATSRMQLLLKEGGIWSQMEQGLRGRFEVKTATASTIIRGTEFRVKVEPGEATRVEVLDGRVDFEVGARLLSVGQQEGALAVAGAEPRAPAPLPAAPSLAAPLPEEVIRSQAFDQSFRWTGVGETDAFIFEMARDERFFDIVEERRVAATDSAVRIQGLEPGTYFWRVSSVREGFEGPPSEGRYFVFVERNP